MVATANNIIVYKYISILDSITIVIEFATTLNALTFLNQIKKRNITTSKPFDFVPCCLSGNLAFRNSSAFKYGDNKMLSTEMYVNNIHKTDTKLFASTI